MNNSFSKAYKSIDSKIHKYEKEEILFYDPNGCKKEIIYKRKEEKANEKERI